MKNKSFFLLLGQLVPFLMVLVATVIGYFYVESRDEIMDMDRLPGAMLLFILLEIALISKRVWRFITAPAQISLDTELISIMKNSKKTIISIALTKFLPTMSYDITITFSSGEKQKFDYFYGYRFKDITGILAILEKERINPSQDVGI